MGVTLRSGAGPRPAPIKYVQPAASVVPEGRLVTKNTLSRPLSNFQLPTFLGSEPTFFSSMNRSECSPEAPISLISTCGDPYASPAVTTRSAEVAVADEQVERLTTRE